MRKVYRKCYKNSVSVISSSEGIICFEMSDNAPLFLETIIYCELLKIRSCHNYLLYTTPHFRYTKFSNLHFENQFFPKFNMTNKNPKFLDVKNELNSLENKNKTQSLSHLLIIKKTLKETNVKRHYGAKFKLLPSKKKPLLNLNA